MSDFKPPKPNKAMIGLAEFILPFYLKFVERLSFKFSETEDRPANFLKGKNVVIVLNHSDRQDPLLLIALAKYMHENFYCLVARESFDAFHGILGWIFQRLGCFSVDRGSTDFKSIHTTKSILTDIDKKLIVFPEGEVTGDDHTVHEVNPSLMHIFINAQKSIANDQSSQSLWVLPIGVSYKLETQLHASVDKMLTEIEAQFNIKTDHRADVSERAINAVASLLRKYAAEYDFELPENLQQHERTGILARHICQRIADELETKYDSELPTEQLFYCLRSAVAKIAASGEINKQETCESEPSKLEENAEETTNQKPNDQETNKQEAKLKEQEGKAVDEQKPIRSICTEWTRDLNRTERLLILQRVLNQKMSPIQVCRVTDFLELEAFGRMTAKGRQSASVFFGNPIEVLPFLKDYESDKSSAVEKLRDAVRQGLQSALDNSRNKLHAKPKRKQSESLEQSRSVS